MSKRVGFVGLGNIGRPMALRIVGAGFETRVYDVDPGAVRVLVEAGAKSAASPAELAAGCSVIGLCVRDDADVRAVLHGESGVLSAIAPGCVIAIHSTILPSTVEELGRAAAERGVGLLDAPMTGGAAGAQAGTLTFMVGGAEPDLERCRGLFSACASRIVHTGPLGTGAATKLCNNLMTYLGFLSAFEATLLASRAGLSLSAFEEVTRANGNLTDQMRAFLALHKIPANQQASEAFQAQLRSFTTLAEKDLAATLAFARENGVALPGAGLCQQLMARVYGLEDSARR
ncbi:MAG: NAD(P)-dependent oxidoreductase [Myxococcota bacterium]